jgi:glycerophosphoryl diester phosphodiesterase
MKYILKTSLILIIFTMMQCKDQPVALKFDIQGHRGCRGLYPENTMAAFRHALELGVTTLEMDLAISNDGKVVVSHDPYFHNEISTMPDGSEITLDNQFENVLYRLDYDEIKKYDVGIKEHPRFPNQKKINTYKPLLSEVFEMTKEYCSKNNKELPFFNIEIKSKVGFDTRFHPQYNVFVNLAIEIVDAYDLRDKVMIQSFDVRSLNYLNKRHPDITSVYLVETKDPFLINLSKLDFKPDVYSPDYQLVDAQLVKECHERNIRLIPWTVNEVEEMQKLIDLGVDGIITDYPDVLIALMEKNGK